LQTPDAPTSPAGVSRGRLLRILGVGFGLSVAIGNTIAAGIVRTPGEIAAQVSTAWLFLAVWLAGGLYALLGANSLAELATMIPRSGGQYVYSHRALGPYAGFIVGWSDWISTCSTTAAVSIVIGEYTGALIPALASRTVGIAVAVALAFAVLQWRGVRWGSRTQELTAALKTLAFVALVGACFMLGGGRQAAATHAPGGLTLAVAVVLSLQAVIYTYDGWDGIIYFSEEVREPGRDILRSMFGSVLSIMAIYLLLNAALVYVLPMREIAGQTFALGVAAQRIFGAHGDALVRIVMVVSLLSGINAYHLMASRVLFGMSRDGLFTHRGAAVNEGGTPTVALFLSAAVAVAFIVSGSFEKVIAVTAFFFVANYTMSFISLFVLRRREPQTPRPYRAWGYPWTPAAALLGSLSFLAGAVASDTRNSVWALLLLAASYPTYRLLKRIARPASS
jgi:APA family basic amino acid/polyamine antiporter